MAAGTGIYITWITGSIIISIAMIPIFKPPYAKVSIDGFVDMFRRYWAHMIVVFSVYIWKDLLDGLDRVLMANTQLDMTFLVYAIEGEVVLWIQEALRNNFLDHALTHFYVMGFMIATFSSFIYPIYFDDRYMADRVSLTMFWVYVLAIPFYLFLNVRVTGDYIEGMETIAYDVPGVYSVEIHNWFNRIDPFTNGMPSLHIGLPFAIWLTLHRWDEDGRWQRFRVFLIGFILLTAFSIIYLGIHWITDIIGGMIVAIMAVRVTEMTHEPIWKVADERLFTRRVARILDDPRTSISNTLKSSILIFEPIKEPGRKQTGAFILALFFLTGSVLLWDATHQNFTIDELQSPTAASGSGEWLVSIEENSQGILVTAWNVTSLENRTVGGGNWLETPKVITSGSCFVLYSDHRLDYFEHNSDSGVLEPISRAFSDLPILDIAIGFGNENSPRVSVLTNDQISILNAHNLEEKISILAYNSKAITSAGSLIAASTNSVENLPSVNITSMESNLTISITLDPRSDNRTEQSMVDSGVIFDYNNSSVVDLAMNSRWLVAVVDVGPLNRTILVDTISINQTLISNPRWDSSSPSISAEKVAFLQVTRDNPANLNQVEKRINDVYIFDLVQWNLVQITNDDEINQLHPQILDDRVAWIAYHEGGKSEVVVHSFGEAIEPYSSLLLQSSIVVMIPLIFVWASQHSSEKREPTVQ